MTRSVAALFLAMLWLGITGSFTFLNLVLGLVVAAIALSFVGESWVPTMKRPHLLRLLALAAVFVRELVLSAWKVARLVLSPTMDLKPGIFAYPLAVKGDFEITLLANLITLTPGTLSVDVSPDRKLLYVHAIDCSDPQQTCREIHQAFERRIMETFAR